MRIRDAVLWSCLAGCSFDASGVPYDGVDAAEVPVLDAGADAPSGSDGGVTTPPVDASPPVGSRFCDPADADLVACYRFEVSEQSAQPFDESSYGNHGTSRGVSYVPGPPGAGLAIKLDKNAEVRIPDSESLDVPDAITIELWLFVDVLPVGVARAGLVDNERQWGMFLSSRGEVRCAIGAREVFGALVAAKTWTHLACTYDGAAVSLYQDGALVKSTPATGVIGRTGKDGVAIGQNSPSGDPLDGVVDQVRLWRVARTQPQICAAAAGTCAQGLRP